MDVKRFTYILIGVVLIAFGIGIFSLRYNDNFQLTGINGSRSINIRSKGSSVRIGLDGIEVKDGDDHVRVGWDGIKVTDGDDEVNVGWNGIRVTEGDEVKFDFFNFGSWLGVSNRDLKTENIREEKNISFEGIKSIKLSSSFIDINLTSEEREDIYVNYHGRIRSNIIPTLQVKDRDGILFIELVSNANSYSVSESNVVLEVFLPTAFTGHISIESSSGDITVSNLKEASLDIDNSSGDVIVSNHKGDDINIRTSSGDIYLKNISASDYYINASSGEISLDSLEGDKLLAKSSSGDISSSNSLLKGVELTTSSGYVRLENLNSNNTFIETTSGNITSKESIGNFTLTSSSGGITLDNTSNYDNYHITSNSGDIDIKLPHDSNYFIKGSSSSGRYTPSNNLDVRINNKGNFEATLGNGEKTINITTSSGDVRFR